MIIFSIHLFNDFTVHDSTNEANVVWQTVWWNALHTQGDAMPFHINSSDEKEAASIYLISIQALDNFSSLE